MESTPLIFNLGNLKADIKSYAIANQQRYNLPNYLMELVFADILGDFRSAAKDEMAQSLHELQMNAAANGEQQSVTLMNGLNGKIPEGDDGVPVLQSESIS